MTIRETTRVTHSHRELMTAAEPMLPHDVLLAAAAEIELNGHARTEFGTCDGPKCMDGALSFVTCGDPNGWNSVSWYLVRALGIAEGDQDAQDAHWEDYFAWNDDAARTKRDVIEALHDAAWLAESEGQ